MRRRHAHLKHAAARVLGVLAGLALSGLIGCGSGRTSSPEARPARPAARDAATTARSTPTRSADRTAAQEPSSASAAPGAGAADASAWRPSWWIAAPTRAGGMLKVAAMADDADLLAARRRAVNLGLAELRAELAEPEDGTIESETTIDVIHLPNGHYRAFVLVQAPY